MKRLSQLSLAALLHPLMVMAGRQRTSRSSSIDGGEKAGHAQYFDDEETLVDDPIPVNDFSELEDDGDETPSERRRDPLRRKL